MQFTGPPPLGFETFCVIDRHRAGTISEYPRLKSGEKSAIFALIPKATFFIFIYFRIWLKFGTFFLDIESRNREMFLIWIWDVFLWILSDNFFSLSAFWKGSGSENGFSGN